jgi:DNA-binding CsgD family transcriptional regulator
MDKTRRTRQKVDSACRDARTAVDLLDSVRRSLAADVPADRWCVLTLDPATALATGGNHENGFSAHLAPRLMELEFAGEDVNLLSDLARSAQPVSTLSLATAGDPARSTRYREVIVPDGLRSELRAVFRDAHGPWGALILLRETDTDFSAEEVATVSAVTEQVTRSLRRVLLLGEIEARDDDEALFNAPALIMLEAGATMAIRHASTAAAHWLAEIQDGSAGELPYALHSVVQRARMGSHAVARLRTRAGRWLTAHAETAGGNEMSLILQPSRPHEIAQVLAAAYGLTPREAEVARLVAAGHGNTEIANLLFVSRYTVEDHLRNSYEKLGVRTRAELVSRLFHDQYLPRSIAGEGLDGQGWFMPARSRARKPRS